MSRVRTTLSTAGAAMLLVLASFTVGSASAPPTTEDRGVAPLQQQAPDEEEIRDQEADDIGVNAVPGFGQAELLYVPIPLCRVVDTRYGTGLYGSRLGDTGGRVLYVAGTTGFETQGGRSGGCGVPASAMAVSATMVAWAPSSDGRLKAWAATATEPSTGNTMIYGSSSLGVGVTLPLASGAGKDLKVRNLGSSTDLIIDVTGYYVPQMYAYVQWNGVLLDHSGRVLSVTHSSIGTYEITWDRNVGSCVGVGNSDYTGYIVSVWTSGNTSTVYVDDNAGNAADYYFNVSLHC